jgi:hypothetical protein
MTIRTRWITLLLPAALLACSSDDSTPADTGTAGSGGTSTAGSGGTSAAGNGGTSAGKGGTSSTAGNGGTNAGGGGTNAGGGGAAGGSTGGSGGSTSIPDAIKVPDATAVVLLTAHGVGAQIYTCTDTLAGAGGAGGGAGSGGSAGASAGSGGSTGGSGGSTGGSGGSTGGSGGSTGGSGGAPQYQWILKAPQADLFDAGGQKIGTHYAGPTWESSVDGSKVVGTKIAAAASPTPGNIPWLLLQAKMTSGTGVFTKVTYIQRLDTKGGVAAVDGCDAAHVGAESSVAYEANYVFSGAP